MSAVCECGCGQPTTVYKGRARRFVSGHNGRKHEPQYLGDSSRESTESPRQLASRFGVTARHIRKIRAGTTWAVACG